MCVCEGKRHIYKKKENEIYISRGSEATRGEVRKREREMIKLLYVLRNFKQFAIRKGK